MINLTFVFFVSSVVIFFWYIWKLSKNSAGVRKQTTPQTHRKARRS